MSTDHPIRRLRGEKRNHTPPNYQQSAIRDQQSEISNTYLCHVKWVRTIAIFPIRVYQAVLSPLLGQNCRHEPTCSQYTVEAIQEWGVFKGIWLGMKRISKCHPWGTMGYDPVPKKEPKEHTHEKV